MWKIHKKDFKDLKSFDEWITWQKEYKVFDNKSGWVFLAVILILCAYAIGYVQGFNFDETDDNMIACTAVGMEHIVDGFDDFYVDSEGNWNRVVINDGKAFIDNQK